MSNLIRNLGRIFGPLMVLIGAILAIIGILDLIQPYNSISPFNRFNDPFSMLDNPLDPFGNPSKILPFIIGIPLFGIGVSISRAAYLKPIADYVAGETQDAVSTLSSAVTSGLQSNSRESQPQTVVACHKCNHHNSADSKYCSSCGTSLLKSKQCTHCNELNDPDARFCDNCGEIVAST